MFNNKVYKLKLVCCFLIALYSLGVHGQTNIAMVKEEFAKINSLYDNASYMYFKMSMNLTTDKVFGKQLNDQEEGEYLINKTNLYYKLGDRAVMQNDSVSVLLLHDVQQAVVSYKRYEKSSDVLPIRLVTDSLIDSLAVDFNMTIAAFGDSLKQIKFTPKDTNTAGLPYLEFSVLYSPDQYYIEELQIKSLMPHEDLELIRPTNPNYIATLTVKLYDYTIRPMAEELEESTYVLFDPILKKYRLTKKYEAYELEVFGLDEPENEGEPVKKESIKKN